MELYFRQCALQLDCRDLALMAATLANGGVQPRNGERVFDPEVVERVLSRDDDLRHVRRGRRVGRRRRPAGQERRRRRRAGRAPGPDGPRGLLPAARPRTATACAASPPAADLPRAGAALPARGHRARARPSARPGTCSARPPAAAARPDEQELLNEYGACARVYALHGDLLFSGAEAVVREFTERADELEVIVLDISRVAEIARRGARRCSPRRRRRWPSATARWRSSTPTASWTAPRAWPSSTTSTRRRRGPRTA